jgi:hypothetical protein
MDAGPCVLVNLVCLIWMVEYEGGGFHSVGAPFYSLWSAGFSNKTNDFKLVMKVPREDFTS